MDVSSYSTPAKWDERVAEHLTKLLVNTTLSPRPHSLAWTRITALPRLSRVEL